MTTLIIVAAIAAVLVASLSAWLSLTRAIRLYRAQDALHVRLAASKRVSPGAEPDADADMISLRERLESLVKELSGAEQANAAVRDEFADVFKAVIDRVPEEDKRKTLRVLQEQPFEKQVRLAQRLVA